jgi:ribonuclease HI
MPSPARPRFSAFTDGSSIVNPGGPGGTGFVVLDREAMAVRFGGTRWVDDGPAGVTNNRMELRSVLDALHGIPGGAAVEITSDSRYVIDALTRWIGGWRRKGWRTSTGGAVMNRDLIEEISAREAELRVRWAWVRGHVGHPVNEICDALASAAARRTDGPAADDVVGALRLQGLLGAGDEPRVVAGGFEPPPPAGPRRGQLSLDL